MYAGMPVRSNRFGMTGGINKKSPLVRRGRIRRLLEIIFSGSSDWTPLVFLRMDSFPGWWIECLSKDGSVFRTVDYWLSKDWERKKLTDTGFWFF